MDKYTLCLKTIKYGKNLTTELPLYSEIPLDKSVVDEVYNDLSYTVELKNEKYETETDYKIYINEELVKTRKLEEKDSNIFYECFGYATIKIIIRGDSYFSNWISVKLKKDSISQNLKNMVNYINYTCNEYYLYENHKSSRIKAGLTTYHREPITLKLSLLQEIYDVYSRNFSYFRYSAQSKAVNLKKVGNFEELQSIDNSTINYIVRHPDELEAVNYNSGIVYNKQFYQPRKTLVNSMAYSMDIYENQVVVGFIEYLVNVLKDIEFDIERRMGFERASYDKDEYIDARAYLETISRPILQEYKDKTVKYINKFKEIYLEYKRILTVSPFKILHVPEYTNIFQNVMPYNMIYQQILKWFNSGRYDFAKTDLMLSFVSVSKIYEYFCLLKINNALESCEYKKISQSSYHNTLSNDTFVFEKNNIRICVYFQPTIYANYRKLENDIDLFRNNIRLINMESYSGRKEDIKFTPDYIIKVTHLDKTNYFILDAKHQAVEYFINNKLMEMVFRYMFSISTVSENSTISGVCFLCGKDDKNRTENIYDQAENLNITPSAKICVVTGADVNDNEDLIKYIQHIEKSVQ